ncbi:MAG TPA: Kazal-type serine protease inhibitor family protein [Nevskiaceae bacterium]|nr:Kazal-type serine protease inhibitor family protein [Nevskiaceae bacterium]
MAVLLAAGVATSLAADQCPAPEPDGRYFLVTGADPRLCPSPTCGGWFVREVNKPKSRCADGTFAETCHALRVDLSRLGLTDRGEARLHRQVVEGHALVRGRLERRRDGDVAADVLVAQEGWAGQAGKTPRGKFVHLRGTDVVCVTAPCPSIEERLLNLPEQGTRMIDGVDLAASGAPEERVARGYEELSQRPGILVAGRLESETLPTGISQRRIASEFYLRVAAAALPPSDGQVCGGEDGIACPAGQFCDLAPAGSCATPGATGTCRTPPEVCPEFAFPVCGCDGVTYVNDCYRQGAGVPLDHEGACAK